MAFKTGYINVYRSGHFHREGKPLTFDRHGGDLYADEAQALAEISPLDFYIATVPVTWFDPEDIQVNGPDSVPVPLSVTRQQYKNRPALADFRPAHDAIDSVMAMHHTEETSLETTEDEARPYHER